MSDIHADSDDAFGGLGRGVAAELARPVGRVPGRTSVWISILSQGGACLRRSVPARS